MARRHRPGSLLRGGCAALAALLLRGCEAPAQFAVADVDPLSWREAVTLVIENRDTTTLRDIELFVRSNGYSADDTLSVRIVSRSPDSLRCEERLVLAIPQRRHAAARTRERTTAYRRRVSLPRSGTYRLTIVPLRPVRGIEAVGARLVASDSERAR